MSYEPNDPAMASPHSPFETTSDRRNRVLRWSVYAGLPALAVVVVVLATRQPDAPPAMAGHDHGAVTARPGAQAISLTDDEAHRIGVTYAIAARGPLRREIRTVGEVTFDETRVTVVAPKVDGWVERLHVDFTGQAVRAGEPLLEIYSPMLVTAQEELLLARHLERQMQASTEDARSSAAELLSSARRRLSYWDIPDAEIARIERSDQVQRTLMLRSPVSGFVVEKNVLRGQKIMAGDALYRVVDLSTVWIEGEVFEQDLASVRVGQGVTADFQALPGGQFRGRIAYIYPTLNAETRTARVRVELPNRELLLKPGMYATFRLTALAHPAAITVPRTAVLVTGERSLVFVRRADGMLEPREIVSGIANDTTIEIVRGLDAGETVVASATFLVDAESNLGTLMGGMGDMPGMDIAAPAKGSARPRED